MPASPVGRSDDPTCFDFRQRSCRRQRCLTVGDCFGRLLAIGVGGDASPASGHGIQISSGSPRTRCTSSTLLTVKPHRFRVYKLAVGQIAFNEDASTVVLTPFSGRVTRVIAKIGDVVKPGDPLFEIDSPEVVQAQTDLICGAACSGKGAHRA